MIEEIEMLSQSNKIKKNRAVSQDVQEMVNETAG